MHWRFWTGKQRRRRAGLWAAGKQTRAGATTSLGGILHTWEQRTNGTGQHTAPGSPERNPGNSNLDSRPGGGAHRNSPDLMCVACTHTHSIHVCACRQTHAYSFTLAHIMCSCSLKHAHSVISLQYFWQNPNSANYIRPTFHPSHQLQLALYLDFLLLWG